MDAREELLELGACGLNTLTSKNASCRLSPQKPCALTSARASSSEFAVLYWSCSPVSGCRVGCTETLGETSVRKSQSSQTIRGNIAGYPLKGSAERWKEIAQRFTQDLRFQRTISLTPEDDFADSITCGLPKIVWRTPTRRIRGRPKDNSADPERRFRGLATDDPRISALTFTEVREFSHRLSRKSATEYRGSLRISVSNL